MYARFMVFWDGKLLVEAFFGGLVPGKVLSETVNNFFFAEIFSFVGINFREL